MGSTARWTLLGLLLAVNAISSVTLGGTWPELVINVLTGLGVIAIVAEYLLRGRRRER
jgi:hypothetical protein